MLNKNQVNNCALLSHRLIVNFLLYVGLNSFFCMVLHIICLFCMSFKCKLNFMINLPCFLLESATFCFMSNPRSSSFASTSPFTFVSCSADSADPFLHFLPVV